MNIGIDKIGFYTPPYALSMEELAKARNVDPNKFTIGLGQKLMAVAPITQDIVTMGANAAFPLLDEEDKKAIDMVLVGTETGIDQSKSAAIYIQQLLGLSNRIRCVELKQACYGATAAMQLAKGHLALNPHSKVLVIASDIAKYGLSSGGEPTQGAGAVAIVLSSNPRILSLDETTSFFTEDIMDFWRPNYEHYPMVNGKFSTEQYIRFFSEVWQDYSEKHGTRLGDFEAICFHLPYAKMGMKALAPFLTDLPQETQERLKTRYQESTIYNRQVGNIYTGSLFLSFISLLENNATLTPGSKIGFFSYGSGAVGEFFSGKLVEGYSNHLQTADHQRMLDNRKQLSISEYEELFNQSVEVNGEAIVKESDSSSFMMTGIQNHQRQYMKK